MIVIVPARGGSKRVPKKNIRMLGGVSLLRRTIDQIARAGLLDRAWVSTDTDEIEVLAQEAGCATIRRPDALAVDSASTESAMLHALDQVDPEGTDEWVMLLPVTSPFRRAETVATFAERAFSAPVDVDCLMSVTENRGDFWRISPESGAASRLFPNAPRRQQDREPLYEENSMIYVTRQRTLRATGSILGAKVQCISVDAMEAFDINTESDFKLAEAWLAIQKRET